MRSCHGGKQVRRERRNAALARQVVADKRDLANFGIFFHAAVFYSSRPALLCTRVCPLTAHVPSQREVGRSVLPECRFRPSGGGFQDRKSTRLNSSHANISYAVFCLK